MIKVKLIKSVFGFDVGVTYDATASMDGDGYIIKRDSFVGFVGINDAEVIND